MLRLTELSGKSADSAEMRSGALGHCRHFFWLGVAFDTVGVAVLFTGVFANLFFYDMLLYLGSIIIFVSLLWWIFWYTGNIEALPEDPLRRTSPRAGEVGMHRSGSRRFSLTIRSVSNTFRRIRRRQRRRLLPRVLQMMSSLSSTDLGQLEGNSDAGTEGGRTSFHPAKPVSILNKLQLCSIQASKSLPLVPLQHPLTICTSRSQPVFSVTSQCYPLVSGASGSYSQMALSSDSQVPVDLDPQGRSKISVASRIYPVQRVDSQSHLLVSVPSESSPVVPVTSQSQVQDSVDSVSSGSYMTVDLGPQGQSKISVASWVYPVQRVDSQSHLLVPVPSESSPVVLVTSQSQNSGSVAKEGQLQNLPSASQTQPETGKAFESHTLGMEVPVVPLGFAQTSQSRSSQVQEVPKNSSAKASETLPAISQKLAEEQLDPSLFVSEVTHSDRQCDPTGNLPATSGVRKSYPF